MLKSIVMSYALVCLMFVSQAVAIAPLSEYYTIGPLLAVGYGPTETVACDNALEDMQDQVDIIKSTLPREHTIIAVYASAPQWDPPICEIEFTVLILEECD